MPLEAATYIDDLVETNPAATDGSGQGDDHLRLIKSVLKATFPAITGAVTLTHTEINALETRADALEAADVALDARLDIVEAAYVKKDGTVAMTGDLNMGSNQITSLGAPSAADDAARKSDVDAKLTDVLTTRGDMIRGGVGGAEERFALGTSGQVLKSDGTDAVWGRAYEYIEFRDEKADGVQGGTFTSGAWRTRTLTTEAADTGSNASLAANQITLAAGTYEAFVSVPAYRCGVHQARLQNTSDGTTTLVGTSEVAADITGGSVTTRSIITGRFTIASSKTFEVQHRCDTTRVDDGFGQETTLGAGEVYTVAIFRKVA